MTDADEPALRRVRSDGVTVEKSLEEDRFPVPAVGFVIRSDRDVPVEVRVTDAVPERIPMDHIGFHPDFESEHWTAYSDHRVQFERTVDPGEEVETVYGIRAIEGLDPGVFLAEPAVDVPTPQPPVEQSPMADPVDGQGPAPDDRSSEDLFGDPAGEPDPLDVESPVAEESWLDEGVVSEPAEAQGSAGAEGDVTADRPAADSFGGSDDVLFGDEPADPLDRASFARSQDAPAEQPSEPRPRRRESRPQSRREHSRSRERRSVALAASLLDELRTGAVDEDVREALRQELLSDSDDQTPSFEVRLDHLQSRVEELSAYTDALEAFIDEGGTSDLVQELEEGMDGLQRDVADIADTLDDGRDDREALHDRLDALEGELAELAVVEDGLDAVESAVSDLEDRMESTESGLAEAREGVAAIRSEASAMAEDVAELANRMEDVEAAADRLDELEGAIHELVEWRERVADVSGR